jgi:hypothetical protein
MTRTFEDQPAVRERVPLLVGLAGASGSGKTFSALRLATGMQSVVGGEIYCIDTEHRRALHYADDFTFRHLPFEAPFSPLDYLAAIEHCVKQGASVVIVDSMSHEHEGPGGVLEMHDAALDRMAGDDHAKRQRMTFTAWAEAKTQRRRLINSILQLGVNAVCCFRAKEKIKIQRGKDPLSLGWMPIGGDEFVYEMTLNCLLHPASGGVPTWSPEMPGEKQMIKLPAQFAGVFKQSQPLSEDIGTALAQWAAGDVEAPSAEQCGEVLGEILLAETKEAVEVVAARHRDKPWATSQRETIRRTIGERLSVLVPESGGPEVDPATGEALPDDAGRVV